MGLWVRAKSTLDYPTSKNPFSAFVNSRAKPLLTDAPLWVAIVPHVDKRGIITISGDSVEFRGNAIY